MKEFLKKQSGVMATDGVIALLIIALFTGIIATVAYNIYLTSTSTKRMAQATQYLTGVFEKIDAMEYNSVNQGTVNNVVYDLNAPSGYNITSTVTNYEKEEGETLDLIKIIETDIQYNIGNKEQTISANHIKAK